MARKVLPGCSTFNWSPAAIRRLRTDIVATQEEFAQIVGVVASTVHRWEKGDVAPDRKTAERLSRLKEIVAFLDKYFEQQGRAAFLKTPDPRLDGDRPMDLLGLPSGVKRIKACINAMRAGDFA